MTDGPAVPRSIATRILRLAAQSTDGEMGGLISGAAGEMRRAWPVRTAARAGEPASGFDATHLKETLSEIHRAGETLMAVFHSHATMPALPVNAEISSDTYPGLLYLAVSQTTKGVLELRGYRWNGQTLQPVAIHV